jgi:AcrR family transcriptional regulator
MVCFIYKGIFMTRYTRHDWLVNALDILGRNGVDAVTIDAMCQHLSVTKGSFYHHFQNHEAFLEALLQYWEERYTTEFIDISQATDDPLEQLNRLNKLVIETHNTSETSIRAWAKVDALARSYQEKVDQRRLEFLRTLHQRLGRTEQEAAVLANLVYAILIGAQEMIPPLTQEELQAIYALLGTKL